MHYVKRFKILSVKRAAQQACASAIHSLYLYFNLLGFIQFENAHRDLKGLKGLILKCYLKLTLISLCNLIMVKRLIKSKDF